MRLSIFRFAPLLSLLLLPACAGTAYQASRSAGFESDPIAEINDDEVKKAFEAKPQLPHDLRLAFFTFAPERAADVDATLRALPGVVSTYEIPAFIATGQRKLDNASPWARPAQPLSLKKLRLLAAQAHCEALVVLDYGYKIDVWVNALVVFNIALLPGLFLPFREMKYESYVQAFVLDTRNGYVYGQVDSREKTEKGPVTIYANDEPVLDAQWGKLREKLSAALRKIVEDRQPRDAAVATGAARAP